MHKLRQQVAFYSCSLASQESGIFFTHKAETANIGEAVLACRRQRFDNPLFDKHIGFQFVYEIELRKLERAGEPIDTHQRENRLRPEKLHIKYVGGIRPADPISRAPHMLTTPISQLSSF